MATIKIHLRNKKNAHVCTLHVEDTEGLSNASCIVWKGRYFAYRYSEREKGSDSAQKATFGEIPPPYKIDDAEVVP